MKKLIMTLAAVSALAAGAPAAAQYANSNIEMRINELQARLQAGVQAGTITRNEAEVLRARLRDLTRLERQFSRDGLSRAERDQLQQRIQVLRQQIRQAERNGDNRPRYDRDDDRDYRDGRACPPGLAKKNNGCLPPGQAGRMDERYNNSGGEAARYGFRDTDRFVYRLDGNRVLQIDRRTGNVVRAYSIRR
jgi:hypothetical protein